jgi:uncharacterized protein YdiU (UPF0061 family)
MIFITRLYEAQLIMKRLGMPTSKPPGSFSFKTYPSTQTSSEDQEKCLTDLVQSIKVDIVHCKKMFNSGLNHLEKVKNATSELSKRLKSIEHHKVKKRTKPKKNDADKLTNFSRLYAEMIKSNENKATKKRKVDRV